MRGGAWVAKNFKGGGSVVVSGHEKTPTIRGVNDRGFSFLGYLVGLSGGVELLQIFHEVQHHVRYFFGFGFDGLHAWKFFRV